MGGCVQGRFPASDDSDSDATTCNDITRSSYEDFAWNKYWQETQTVLIGLARQYDDRGIKSLQVLGAAE